MLINLLSWCLAGKKYSINVMIVTNLILKSNLEVLDSNYKWEFLELLIIHNN